MVHLDEINRWPSLSAFAEDLGIAYGTAKAMRRRGTIPAEYWLTVVAKAAERGIEGITLESLAAAVAADRSPPQDADRVSPAGPDQRTFGSGSAFLSEAAE